MDELTLTALRGSIKKWEDIVHRDGEDRGSANCPLCAEFLKGPTRCEGCPVALWSGMTLCRGTPYQTWAIYADRYYFSRLSEVPKHKYVKDKARELAQAELDFLKSLLPKDEGSE